MSNTIDNINFASATDAQVAAFSVIDRLQNFNSGQQVAGAGLVFLLLCERFKVRPNDMLVKANSILLDSLTGTGEQSRAIKEYLHKEL